jgi:hypothetical protein
VTYCVYSPPSLLSLASLLSVYSSFFTLLPPQLSDLGIGHSQESRMLLVTQLMTFWFCYLTAEQRVLYRPELGQSWVRFRGKTDSSQMTGGLQQANNMRITGQLRQVCEQQVNCDRCCKPGKTEITGCCPWHPK